MRTSGKLTIVAGVLFVILGNVAFMLPPGKAQDVMTFNTVVAFIVFVGAGSWTLVES